MSDPSILAWPRALYDAAARFNNGNGWVLSSHVAMSILLALFPFVLFVVALAGALSREVDADQLIELIFGIWPAEVAGPIAEEIRAVIKGGGAGLMTFGGLLAVWFASNGVDAVRVAITQAYRDFDPRPFWKTRALAIGFVVLGGAVVLAALTFGLGLPAYFHLLSQAVPQPLAAWTDGAALPMLALVALAVTVMAAHLYLPGPRHRLAEIWPGVALTLALWIGAVWLFSLYIGGFADYGATYAGLAGAMAALIFLYLMAAILILGAEFNGALMRMRQD